MNTTPYGFRIVGACNENRRHVDHAAAFSAYAACDERATVEREAYLSAFQFGDDFRDLLLSTGSCRGFDGVCWSPWLWFDIDRADLDTALRDARMLAPWLIERYKLDDDALLIFFSGSKGFHIGLPSSLWVPEPSTSFHRVCRRLAEGIGEAAKVVIDTGVYDRVRAFRAPNSRHPKTGLHKRRLSFDEFQGLSLDGIRKLAEKPAPFDLLDAPPICDRAIADWSEAMELVRKADAAKMTRMVTGNGKPTLNRLTLDFIRNGVGEGDRHRLLYSAARNLGEFDCPPMLAHALLEEAALDSGLPPKDVRRQIECGLKDQGPLPVEQPATPSSLPVPDAGLQQQLAALWQAPAQPPVQQPRPASSLASPESVAVDLASPPLEPALVEQAPSPSPVAAPDLQGQLAALWHASSPPPRAHSNIPQLVPSGRSSQEQRAAVPADRAAGHRVDPAPIEPPQPLSPAELLRSKWLAKIAVERAALRGTDLVEQPPPASSPMPRRDFSTAALAALAIERAQRRAGLAPAKPQPSPISWPSPSVPNAGTVPAPLSLDSASVEPQPPAPVVNSDNLQPECEGGQE